MSRAGTGLTRTKWLMAGLQILGESGIKGLKMAAITKRLGVTTGSFYHHFDGMKEYQEALIEFYAHDVENAFLDEAGAGQIADPKERLLALAETTRVKGFASVYRAMNAWGTENKKAMSAVRSLDRLALLHLTAEFKELGFKATDAKLRAFAYLSFCSTGVNHEFVDPDEVKVFRRAVELFF